ncbi:phosphatidate cytidylyltransferase [Carnobacteriaceae bacterium zg-ZUI252]|nr:phosphatidate cytidylyltransferase [Carnobacteriaceae bacterium zg-ZUI252]
MKQRIITSIFLLAVALPLVWMGGQPFRVVVVGVAVIGFLEIMKMAKIPIVSPEAVIGAVATIGLTVSSDAYGPFKLTPFLLLSSCAFLLLIIMVFSENKFSFERVGVVTLSSLYLGLGANNVISIRSMGLPAMIFILLAIYLTDTGAYFVGRSFGKRKLAPYISPNKSVEGAIGGTFIATCLASSMMLFIKPFNIGVFETILLAFFVSVAGQMGDLVESALKRFYGVKDSGTILPGHGGVLDRFDSILFGVVACQLFLVAVV